MSIIAEKVNELERTQLTEDESMDVSGGRVYVRGTRTGTKFTSTETGQVWWCTTGDPNTLLEIDYICQKMAREKKSDLEVIEYLRSQGYVQ